MKGKAMTIKWKRWTKEGKVPEGLSSGQALMILLNNLLEDTSTIQIENMIIKPKDSPSRRGEPGFQEFDIVILKYKQKSK